MCQQLQAVVVQNTDNEPTDLQIAIWKQARDMARQVCRFWKEDHSAVKGLLNPPSAVKEVLRMIARLCGAKVRTTLLWEAPVQELAVVALGRLEMEELPTYGQALHFLYGDDHGVDGLLTLQALRGVDDVSIQIVGSHLSRMGDDETIIRSAGCLGSSVKWLRLSLDCCQTLGAACVREMVTRDMVPLAEEPQQIKPNECSMLSAALMEQMPQEFETLYGFIPLCQYTDEAASTHQQSCGRRPGYETELESEYNYVVQRRSLLSHLIAIGGCHIPSTEQRGITIWQLRAHYNELQNRCARDGWCSTNPSMNQAPLAAEDVNLYDTMELLIKPLTKERACSFVELVAKGFQTPRWFCSHW